MSFDGIRVLGGATANALRARDAERELDLIKNHLRELTDYINQAAADADKASKEWAPVEDKSNQHYRSGMWYAYNDIRNRIPVVNE